jgi:hypothetical protein
MTTTEHARAVWPSEGVTGFNPVRRIKMSDASISNLQLRTKGLGNNRITANCGWKNRSLGLGRWNPPDLETLDAHYTTKYQHKYREIYSLVSFPLTYVPRN